MHLINRVSACILKICYRIRCCKATACRPKKESQVHYIVLSTLNLETLLHSQILYLLTSLYSVLFSLETSLHSQILYLLTSLYAVLFSLGTSLHSQILYLLFEKILKDISPFGGTTDAPVLDFWWRLPLGFKARGGSLTCVFSPACNEFLRFTSSATPVEWYRCQHGSRPFLIHIPDVSASIGGGSGLQPTTVRAAHSKHGAVNHSATLARLQILYLLTSLYWVLLSLETSLH